MHIEPEVHYSRGGKTQNFPGSNFLRANNFRTKCAKLFHKTSLKSAFLPLTTLSKNANSMARANNVTLLKDPKGSGIEFF